VLLLKTISDVTIQVGTMPETHEYENEAALASAFNQGETHALSFIFKTYYRELCYFAEDITKDQMEAEDIVVDAFTVLWKKHREFTTLSKLKNFLYIVVRNACFNFIKKTKRETQQKKEFLYLTPLEEQQAGHARITAEFLQLVYHEIEHLPGQCRKVFELLFIHGLSYPEVAERLSISERNARNQKARALLLLRKRLLEDDSLVPVWFLLVLGKIMVVLLGICMLLTFYGYYFRRSLVF
jgi:RNA polymerase sigma-70 factor (family 1)